MWLRRTERTGGDPEGRTAHIAREVHGRGFRRCWPGAVISGFNLYTLQQQAFALRSNAAAPGTIEVLPAAEPKFTMTGLTTHKRNRAEAERKRTLQLYGREPGL